MHRQRLENMRSALDTSAPAAMPHLQLYGRDYAAKKRATTEAAFSDLAKEVPFQECLGEHMLKSF